VTVNCEINSKQNNISFLFSRVNNWTSHSQVTSFVWFDNSYSNCVPLPLSHRGSVLFIHFSDLRFWRFKLRLVRLSKSIILFYLEFSSLYCHILFSLWGHIVGEMNLSHDNFQVSEIFISLSKPNCFRLYKNYHSKIKHRF